MTRTLLKILYVLGSVGSVAIGAWMLLSPASWYSSYPGGITDTGPLNAHFVRDIGIAYVVVGGTFAWCAGHVTRARLAHLLLTAYFGGHALLHVVDLISGRLPLVHWLMDIPGVFFPAIIMGVFALPPVWRAMDSLGLVSNGGRTTEPDV